MMCTTTGTVYAPPSGWEKVGAGLLVEFENELVCDSPKELAEWLDAEILIRDISASWGDECPFCANSEILHEQIRMPKSHLTKNKGHLFMKI